MPTLLARGYRVQVSADAVTWLTLTGLNDFNPSVSPQTAAADDYESDGWSSAEVVMQSWKVTVKANRKATGSVEDPAFALLRARVGQFGDSARIYVRYFRKDGIAEAKSGRAIVEMTPSKTGVADLNEWTISFTGDGALADIANPYAPASAPVITAASPSGAATGALVTITGSGFVGTVATTGVKFGATNATNWTVLGDSTIVATVPTGTAGAANIVVTNATGASTAFPYTRG
jgi:hypothetical protein